MGTPRERRRSFRVATTGVMLLWGNARFAGCYGLRDVSLGGCGLFGAPSTAFGDHFEATLRFNGGSYRAIPATLVQRRGEADAGLAIDASGSGVQDAIQDLLTGDLECRGARATDVLIVHDRRELVAGLLRMLERLGHRAREASTPLDVLWMLANNAPQVHSAIVAQTYGEHDGRELLRFLARGYPRIRRVLWNSDNSDDPPATTDRCHTVLHGPADLSSLRCALPAGGWPAAPSGKMRLGIPRAPSPECQDGARIRRIE